MSEPKPMFVKITGPGRYRIVPYSRGGWAVFGGWALAHLGVMSLLALPAMRERWWLVLILALALLAALLAFIIPRAVPADQLPERRR